MNETVYNVYIHMLVYKGKVEEQTESIYRNGRYYLISEEVGALDMHLLVFPDYIAEGTECV